MTSDPHLLNSILTVNDRKTIVLLTPSYILWKHVDLYDVNETTPLSAQLYGTQEMISLDTVVAVVSTTCEQLKRKSSVVCCYRNCTIEEYVYSFVVHTVKRENNHIWRTKDIVFSCADLSECEKWVDTIRDTLQIQQFNRPHNLLVFINPIGGFKKGPSIYAQQVAPLFELANISTTIITTQKADHARNYLLEEDISQYDGIICVGGDGLFSEIVHGLLLRSRVDAGSSDNDHGPDSNEISPSLRIGVIGAGSTDAIVCSSNGTRDPITSALHIIIGDSIGMDVMTVHCGNAFVRYNVSFMSYGFYGDLIADSERFRWMGPKRYDYLGVKKFLLNRSYFCEFSFLPCKLKENNPVDSKRCLENCQICLNAPKQELYEKSNSLKSESEWRTVRGRFISVSAVLVPCRCVKVPDGVSPSAHLGDGCTDLILLHQCSRKDHLSHLLKTAQSGNGHLGLEFVQTYRVRAFRFTPLTTDGQSIFPEFYVPSPHATPVHNSYNHQLSDNSQTKGDIRTSQGTTNDYINSGLSVNQEDHQVQRPDGGDVESSVVRGQYDYGYEEERPGLLRSNSRLTDVGLSVWNCDGEALSSLVVNCKVHCQLIRLFSRGVEKELTFKNPQDNFGSTIVT